MSNRLDSMIALALSRRMFLQRSAVALGSAVLGGPVLAAAKKCKLTQPDILGPMYNFGAPFQAKLIGADEPGDRLMLTGTVLGSDCRTPLPHTIIEVWQADHSGQYDKTEPGNFFEASPPFHLRGILMSDAKGRYEIETIVPGAYPIPPGLPGLEKYAGLTRARHIHFRLHPPLHVPLTTQLYFKGDPYLATDPWAGHKPSLVIDPKQSGQWLRGDFDFVLSTGLADRRRGERERDDD